MTWFVIFATTVFGAYFWRGYRVQQRDLQSASSPWRMGERYIGQVVTVPGRNRGRPGPGQARTAEVGLAGTQRARRR